MTFCRYWRADYAVRFPMRYSWLLRSFFERSRCRRFIWLLLSLFVGGLLFLGYLCPDWLCAAAHREPPETSQLLSLVDNNNHQLTHVVLTLTDSGSNEQLQSAIPHAFSPDDVGRVVNFDGEHDILVFLHIQKTGGSTFGRHLVRDAVGVPVPCECRSHRKRCNCTDGRGRQWLFSRYSTGWVCGLHADWTELHECVPNVLDEREGEKRTRRYLYFTVLRDPLQRYISEWKHVQRGSTWQSAKLMCNGRQATLHEVPFCFHGTDWTGVSLEEFMSCPYNLANNRQTRMLANLTLVGCYDKSVMPDPVERDRVLLQSAKDNLRRMAFFGLTERQADMQYLFEQTFGIHFRREFMQFGDTHASKAELTDDQLKRLQALNHLDIELYRFANDLFNARLKHARLVDTEVPRKSSSDDLQTQDIRLTSSSSSLLNSVRNRLDSGDGDSYRTGDNENEADDDQEEVEELRSHRERARR